MNRSIEHVQLSHGIISLARPIAVAEARGESAMAPSNDHDEDDTAANEGQAHEAWRGDAVDIADQQLCSLNGYGAIEEWGDEARVGQHACSKDRHADAWPDQRQDTRLCYLNDHGIEEEWDEDNWYNDWDDDDVNDDFTQQLRQQIEQNNAVAPTNTK